MQAEGLFVSQSLRDCNKRGGGWKSEQAVEPLLVTHNASERVEGVKYDHLSAVFINAFKEQQAQIAQQQEEIKQQSEQNARQQRQLKQQQQQIESLKKLACLDHLRAQLCKQ